jgi:ABC-type Fe3+ transport system permease subunit
MLLVVHGKRSFGLYESFDKTLAVLPYFLDLFGARTVARCVFPVAVDASSASGSTFTGAVLACAVTTSDYIGTVLLRVAVLLTFVAAPYFPICVDFNDTNSFPRCEHSILVQYLVSNCR